MKSAIKNALRRLTYVLGYQNLEHLTLLLESRARKVDEFFILQFGTSAVVERFVARHRSKVRMLALDPSVTHVDLLCARDADTLLQFDFGGVRPVIVFAPIGDAPLPTVVALLRGHGYDVMVRARDVVAHRRDRLAV